jgi:hypothetical protein
MDSMMEFKVKVFMGIYPEGISSFSPGLRRSRYPGCKAKHQHNSEGVEADRDADTTPSA